MTKKQDNSEDKEPEDKGKAYNGDEPKDEDKKKDDAGMLSERMAAIEQKLDQILEMATGQRTMADDDTMDEDKKKDHAEDMDEDKKKEDKDEEEDKKKEGEEEDDKKKEGAVPEDKENVEGEPNPGEKEVKLPQAAAGETNEDAKPEEDVVNIVEKKVNSIMKKYGIRKTSTTPRVEHEIAKRHEVKKVDFARDLMKRVRSGKITQADMNREVKNFVAKNYNDSIGEFLEADRARRGA